MTIKNEIEIFQKNFSEKQNNYNNFSEKNIRSEFFQIKIMEFIAQKEYWRKMTLVWWSALRHLRNWVIKTLDLDYDSIWIDEEYFEKIYLEIGEFLVKSWCKVMLWRANREWRTEDDAYICTFVICTGINKYNNKSLVDAEITLRLKNSNCDYPTEWIIPSHSINNIAIQTEFISSLLSKEICLFLSRPIVENVAKDLINIVFLLQEATPDYDYLYRYEGISNKEELINRLEAQYNRFSDDEDLSYSIYCLWDNLINLDYSDVPYDAIQIIKDQLNHY